MTEIEKLKKDNKKLKIDARFLIFNYFVLVLIFVFILKNIDPTFNTRVNKSIDFMNGVYEKVIERFRNEEIKGIILPEGVDWIRVVG